MTDTNLRTSYIEVQAPVEARDPTTNESRRSWIRFKSFWVTITPNRSREKTVAGSQESTVSHTLRGDYFDGLGVKAEHRIIFEGRVLNIVGIAPDDSFHREWMAHCLETDEVP